MLNLNDIGKEFAILNSHCSSLDKLIETEYGFCISGNLSIIDSNAWNWGTYQIEIWIPATYPTDLPLLVETGNAIERHIDWHISKDGICCVGTLARQYRDMADGISLIKWLELFAIPYLANHCYKKELKEYSDGELAHGVEGIFQDYVSCFNLKEPKEIISRINYILGFKQQSLNQLCFCGSSKKYKRCFLVNPQFHQLGIPIKVLQNDLKKLKSYYLFS
jgi:hypothetical protein